MFQCVCLHSFYAVPSQQCLSFHTTGIPNFSCCAGSSAIVPELPLLLFLKLGALAANAEPGITFCFYSSQLKSHGSDMLNIDTLNNQKQK